MTIEERARKVMAKWTMLSCAIDHDRLTPGTNLTELIFVEWIVDALRDQIEECAKICDPPDRLKEILQVVLRDRAAAIRALAAPTEKGKED